MIKRKRKRTKLRKLLQELCVRQSELAAAVGIKQNTLHNHVANGVKTMRIAKRYAAALGCDPRDLLEE
jgi:DNA-binding Xre family transcriptional regulator